jgi:hypothetical protein
MLESSTVGTAAQSVLTPKASRRLPIFVHDSKLHIVHRRLIRHGLG